MERYLVNIKIENNCFYLFFNDDTIKKIDFTNQNFKSLLNYYSNHEYFYKSRNNNNFQDYNTNTSNNLSNTDKTKGKILEFKRK